MLLARLVVAWGINAAALWAANAIFDGVRIHGWAAYLIGSAVLGVANAVIKPLLAILTLPLIVVTLGISYFLLNIAMLALAAWIAPHFSVSGYPRSTRLRRENRSGRHGDTSAGAGPGSGRGQCQCGCGLDREPPNPHGRADRP